VPHVDFNAAKAARAEGEKEPKTFDFGPTTFSLPDELRMKVLDFWTGASPDTDAGFRLLLDGQFDEFQSIAHNDETTFEDMKEIIEGILAMYGINLGEARASLRSSPSSGRQSRPTSSGSTVSTLPRPAGAPKRSERAASRR
jgi:hypothetical protein